MTLKDSTWHEIYCANCRIFVGHGSNAYVAVLCPDCKPKEDKD